MISSSTPNTGMKPTNNVGKLEDIIKSFEGVNSYERTFECWEKLLRFVFSSSHFTFTITSNKDTNPSIIEKKSLEISYTLNRPEPKHQHCFLVLTTMDERQKQWDMGKSNTYMHLNDKTMKQQGIEQHTHCILASGSQFVVYGLLRGHEVYLNYVPRIGKKYAPANILDDRTLPELESLFLGQLGIRNLALDAILVDDAYDKAYKLIVTSANSVTSSLASWRHILEMYKGSRTLHVYDRNIITIEEEDRAPTGFHYSRLFLVVQIENLSTPSMTYSGRKIDVMESKAYSILNNFPRTGPKRPERHALGVIAAGPFLTVFQVDTKDKIEYLMGGERDGENLKECSVFQEFHHMFKNLVPK